MVDMKVLSVCLLTLIAIYYTGALEPGQQDNPIIVDASAFCFSCAKRRNHKDLYADENNCHNYIQCFFINETYAIGIPRMCPPKQFFHKEILQCAPEGSVPCVDQCQDQAISSHGCYAETSSCTAFYICANTISHQMCCPPNTRFQEATCSCESDDTCTDVCTQEALGTTSVKPASNNGTFCEDSYGNTLQPVQGQPDKFTIFYDDNEGLRSYELDCPQHTQFDIETCRCNKIVGFDDMANVAANKRCLVHLRFDDDYSDSSIHQFSTHPYGYTSIDKSTAAKGAGSLYIDGSGWVEIPGMKSLDLGRAASWCLFYRCHEGVDLQQPGLCTKSGGLLSNNKDSSSSEFTVKIGSTPNGPFGTIRYQHFPPSLETTVADTAIENHTDSIFEEQTFTQLCIVYTGSHLQIYVDNILVATEEPPAVNASLKIGHCPYAIGNDQGIGDFAGNIDEVVICDRALTPDEINAHWQGPDAMFAAGLVPKPSAPIDDNIQEEDITSAWTEYLKNFEVTFTNNEDEAAGFEQFQQRYIAIARHNQRYAKGLEGYSMKIYRGMHMKWKQLAAGKLGFSLSEAEKIERKVTPTLRGAADNLPRSKHWLHCLDKVPDQGTCGSCYHFTALAVVQSAYCAKYNQKIGPLSVQTALDCCGIYWGNYGCNGGLMDFTWECIQETRRVDYEEDNPYTGKFSGTCPVKPPDAVTPPVQIVSIKYIDTTIEAVMLAITNHGAVACGMYAGEELMAYEKGRFCSKTCPNAPNHAVTLVGYGCRRIIKRRVNGRIVTRRIGEYFIMRNSWGNLWGYMGHAILSATKNCRTCGVFSMCSCVTVNSS